MTIMARSYRKPMMNVEKFVANEYVAACGESGVVYKFTCDAGGGVSGSVYLESNGKEGLQKTGGWGYRADTYLSGYHACGTTHEAESTDSFLNGYYVVDGGLFEKDTVTPVIVWRGEKGNNTHCTTNLDMNSWTTAKS